MTLAVQVLDFLTGAVVPSHDPVTGRSVSRNNTTQAPVWRCLSKEVRMNVRPLADRILVRRIEEQEMKRGGIIIPDTAKEKPQRGKVTAVGNGKVLEDGTRVELEVKKGDQILFGKYAGTEVKIDGSEYLILREDDVLAILSK